MSYERHSGWKAARLYPALRLEHVALQDLAHTLRARLVEHPRFAAPKRPPSTFAVDHYAGLVAYACDAMMDKNKDFVVAEHQSLMANSRFPFVQCAPYLLCSCGREMAQAGALGSGLCWPMLQCTPDVPNQTPCPS